MTTLVVTGAGVVSAAGVGTAAMTRALSAGAPVMPDVTGMYSQPLPYPSAHAFTGFDVRALLGRKNTGFIDRATALTLVACGQAIEDSGMVVDGSGERIGITLGTTVGSLSSSSDYSRETLVADRPYLVNPMLFPNTVMNCAAGQAAIRYGLKGVNSTVAGGRIGFLSALRYAVNVLRRGYADTMLVGAVEEFTPHTAWTHRRLGRQGLPGEAAAIFVIEPRHMALAQGRRPVAELAAVTAAYLPGAGPHGLDDRLGACLRQTLAQAGLRSGDLGSLAVSETGDADDDLIVAAETAAGSRGTVVRVRDVLGDCGAATGALQFAALLAPHLNRPGRDGAAADEPGTECTAAGRTDTDREIGDAYARPGPGLLVGWTPEGAFGAAVIMACGGR